MLNARNPTPLGGPVSKVLSWWPYILLLLSYKVMIFSLVTLSAVPISRQLFLNQPQGNIGYAMWEVEGNKFTRGRLKLSLDLGWIFLFNFEKYNVCFNADVIEQLWNYFKVGRIFRSALQMGGCDRMTTNDEDG